MFWRRKLKLVDLRPVFFFVQTCYLYPYPQASVYPPPSSHGYQTYLGEENPSYNWPGQPAPSDRGPHLYSYQDDPDCLTFLRGWYDAFSGAHFSVTGCATANRYPVMATCSLAGLCCCCLLEQCCYYWLQRYLLRRVSTLLPLATCSWTTLLVRDYDLICTM